MYGVTPPNNRPVDTILLLLYMQNRKDVSLHASLCKQSFEPLKYTDPVKREPKQLNTFPLLVNPRVVERSRISSKHTNDQERNNQKFLNLICCQIVPLMLSFRDFKSLILDNMGIGH